MWKWYFIAWKQQQQQTNRNKNKNKTKKWNLDLVTNGFSVAKKDILKCIAVHLHIMRIDLLSFWVRYECKNTITT